MITGFSLNGTDETSLIKNFITFPHLAFLYVVLHFTLLKGRRRSSQLPLLYTTKANFEDAEDAAMLLLPPLPGNAQKRAGPTPHGRQGLQRSSGSLHRFIPKRSSRKGASVMRALTMRVRRSL